MDVPNSFSGHPGEDCLYGGPTTSSIHDVRPGPLSGRQGRVRLCGGSVTPSGDCVIVGVPRLKSFGLGFNRLGDTRTCLGTELFIESFG